MSPQIPKRWVSAKIGDVLTFEYGKGLTNEKRNKEGKWPVYGSNGIVGYHSAHIVNEPCLIVGRKGAVGCVHYSKVPSWPIDTTYYVIPPEGIEISFLYYYLSRLNLKSLDKSTAIPGFNRNDAYSLPIILPPLPEQNRIVAKIEELFSDLDAGVKALKKAKAQLRLYRQAILKAAFEGRLTDEWREAHKGEFEPALRSFERTLIGKKLSDKHFNLFPLNINFPELPDNWKWASIGEIGEVSGGLTKNSKREQFLLKLPYLRVANVYANELRLEDVQYIGLTETELKKVLLEKGDLLIVEGNGSIDQIGRVALWDGSIAPCVHQNHIIKVRVNPIEAGKYIVYWLSSKEGRDYITNVASSTSGLYTLSISKVSKLPIPFAPIAEQQKIVEEIERLFSIVDAVETAIDQSFGQSEHLRQSILKTAFSGQLVPQDPEDEPAEVLLARIQEEKAKQLPVKKLKRKAIQRKLDYGQ